MFVKHIYPVLRGLRLFPDWLARWAEHCARADNNDNDDGDCGDVDCGDGDCGNGDGNGNDDVSLSLVMMDAEIVIGMKGRWYTFYAARQICRDRR